MFLHIEQRDVRSILVNLTKHVYIVVSWSMLTCKVSVIMTIFMAEFLLEYKNLFQINTRPFSLKIAYTTYVIS